MTYFEQKVLNAEPIELVQMLYQRALDCVRDARRYVAPNEVEPRCVAINQAYAIVAELRSSLNSGAAPELGSRLEQLYLYIERRLTAALTDKTDAPLEEVLRLLTTLSEAWFQLPVSHAEKDVAIATGGSWRQMEGGTPARFALSA